MHGSERAGRGNKRRHRLKIVETENSFPLAVSKGLSQAGGPRARSWSFHVHFRSYDLVFPLLEFRPYEFAPLGEDESVCGP
ncbi:hypothetical protein ACRALDRAFT_2059528 [Sodiomyces alcalophilus JCM 7366]|uniref:uncharacterized protein n=1 Tax=Sodiomyces alcalophilus JCM 7366 TaxID=591952 RepID=UPI0039B47603